MAKAKRTSEAMGNTAKANPPENKAERFHRLAEDRVNAAIKRIRLVGQLSNTQTYDYTTEQATAIINALTAEVNKAKERFNGSTSVEKVFTLNGF